MTETLAGHAEFLMAEVAFWRRRAEHAEQTIRGMIATADHDRPSGFDLPPEPPVGTVLRNEGVVVWTRVDEDGWVCAHRACRNCPADWFEVVEQGGLGCNRELP